MKNDRRHHRTERAFAITDVGPSRYHNDDGFFLDDRLGLYAVIDAMAAHGLGVHAVKAAESALAHSLPGTGPAALLHQIHHAIRRLPQTLGVLRADVTLVSVAAATTQLAHAGNTRAYLVRSSSLTQCLTSDQTWVADQVRLGLFPPSDLRDHMLRDVRTNDLGYDPDPKLETLSFSLLPDDTLFLCSDGVWRFITSEVLQEASLLSSLEGACDHVLSRARVGGSNDVMTVLMLRPPSPRAA